MDQLYAIKAPKFPLMTVEIDLSDADAVSYYTGLSDASALSGAVVSESMMGSQAYSLVLARVSDPAKAEETARAILDGVNPAKWICVQADDLDAAVSGDLVLFVMIGSQFDLPAADLIGAFKTLCGGTLDKELSK